MSGRLRELPLSAHLYYLKEYYLRRGALWDGAAPSRLRFLEGVTPGRALDAGCGTGRNALALAGLGWDVVGVDLSSAAARGARRAGIRCVCAPATAIGDGELAGPFDLVLDVLGPASDLSADRRVLYANCVHEVLARDGIFAVMSFESQDMLVSRFDLDRAKTAAMNPDRAGRWWILRSQKR